MLSQYLMMLKVLSIGIMMRLMMSLRLMLKIHSMTIEISRLLPKTSDNRLRAVFYGKHSLNKKAEPLPRL